MDTGKINILMVLDNTGRGGSQSFVMNVCRSIDRNRFHIDIAVARNFHGGYEDEFKKLGCRIIRLPHFNVANYFRFVGEWNEFLSTNRYDIIHGNVSSTAKIYLKIAHKYGCRTILHSHSASYRGGWLERFVKKIFTHGAYRHADMWFACSDEAAFRVFNNRFRNNPRYHLIPNAIDVESYCFDTDCREKMRKQLGFGDDNYVIGHVGSFSHPKNHTFLLNIFKEFHRRHPQSRLLIVGDGYLRGKIETKIQQLGLYNDVTLTGNVGNVKELLMAMDAMVFPSLFEGFGFAPLEAQASGLPVVMSDTVPNTVILSDLVRTMPLSESPQAWCDVIEQSKYGDRQQYNRIIAETDFNINKMVHTLENLYSTLGNK